MSRPGFEQRVAADARREAERAGFHSPREQRLQRFENADEWPLAIAAVIFLAAYAWPILQPGLAAGWRSSCRIINWTVWGIFIADYLVRLTLADPRWRWFGRHLPDLAILALPMLRPLRLVELFTVLQRRAADSLRGKIVIYVVLTTALLVFVASLAVLDAERGRPGSNIENFGDAVWWAITTISTVGYGDRYPVTVEGRFVAAGLMIGGVALLGVVTASVASWLIDRVRDVTRQEDTATRSDVESLRAEIQELKAIIAASADNQHRSEPTGD